MAAADWTRLYPFTPRELLLDGHRLRYLDEGSGSPLLFVHGNPTWSFYWRKLILGLRDRYRCIAPDHIGCGLSDKPRDYPYRLSQHVENLWRLIERLDLADITLVGHDWGGAIGMGAAVRSPNRFGRFVLMNTAAFRDPRIPWRIRICRTPGLGRLAVMGMNAFSRAALRMAVARPKRLSAEVKAGYLAPYDSWDHRRAVYEFVRDIPLKPGDRSYRDLEQVEAGLSAFRDYPVLLVWGMQDWCFTPHFLRRFTEIFPQAKVSAIEDAGHWVAEEAEDEVLAGIEEFLARRPAAVV